jgi:hypothetical protein
MDLSNVGVLSATGIQQQRFDLVRFVLFALGVRDFDQALGRCAIFF